jgi:hypothetical protein
MTQLQTRWSGVLSLPRTGACVLSVLGLWLTAACGSDNGSPPPTGAACTAVTQCYPGLDQTKLMGAAECLDKVSGGYCTHHCAADTDCCALKGECPGNRAEVCAPFESTTDQYCFLSCEAADLKAANLTDANKYCQTYAAASFTCRSTGGGTNNRKVCMQ